jgi:chitodextrinase
VVRVLGALAALLATVVAVQVASSSGPGGGFVYGFTEDLPKEIGSEATAPAQELGAKAFRVTLMWEPGQTALTDTDVARLDKATGAVAGAGMRYVLAVYANAGYKAPRDAAARDAYCAYTKSVLDRYGSIRDVVLWNEPNKNLFFNGQIDGTAAVLYEQLLARCYDVLHAAHPSVNVIGLALSSTGNDTSASTSPGVFLRAVGDAYRASGRTQPLFDTVGFHPYGADATERPWRKHIQSKTMAMGDWNKLMYGLYEAFHGTGQPIPGEGGVTIWYMEIGYQTAIENAALYTNAENVKTLPDYAGGEPDAPAPAETTAAPDQFTQVLDSTRLAYCQPYVAAYFNFLLADEPTLVGWQSGALWSDRSRKDSYPAFQRAIAEVNAGSVDCGTLKGGRPSGDFMPPAVPQGLQGAPQRDPLRVVLTWSPAADDASAVAYRVYRNGALLGTTTATTWTNTTVASGTTYTYSVRAIDSAGNLGDSTPGLAMTTPDTVAPAPPASLAVEARPNPGRVELTWPAATDDVGVTAYELSRDGAVLATVTTTSYTDAAVAGTTTYSYAVVALDAAGNRSSAATATATTPDLTAPGVPAPTATAYGDRVALAWSAATDDVGVTAYDVYRDGTLLASVASTSYTDTAVAQGAAYTYAVRARDAAGNVGAAGTVSATVPDATAPSAPGGLAATSSSGRVGLTWSAASDNVGIAAYEVLRDGALVARVTATSYADTAVVQGRTYGYSVRAVDAAGNRGPSAAASVTVADTTAPSVPAGLRAQALSSPPRVALAWSASSDNVGVRGYRVYRDGVLVATTSGTSFTDTGVRGSRTYRYQLTAYDAAGNASGATVSVSATTPKR